MVWPYLKVVWFRKDDSAGHIARKTKKKVARRRGGKTIFKKWTEMDFASSTRAAADRTMLKGIIVKSSWCANDLS